MAQVPPLREGNPLVFVVSHWINLLGMFFLALSGFYIHWPFVPGLMGVARGMHFFWMFVVIFNLIFRIIGAFVFESANLLGSRMKEKDIKNWLPQEENRHQFWPTLKYYLFMKKTYPITAKYAPLQKLAYLFVVVLIAAAAYTGFCLWAPTQDMAFFKAGIDITSKWFDPGMGGGAIMPIRVIHYWIMWAILVFTMIHLYLANIYSLAPSKLMLFWKEDERIKDL